MNLHSGVTAPPALIVQEMHRPPAPFLRYIDQVVGGENRSVTFRYSQGVLTQFDIDVVHVADEHLGLLLGTARLDSSPHLMSVALLVRNLRRHNIALVRTLSRRSPAPSRNWNVRQAWSLLDKATDAFVVFDESVPTPAPEKTVVIPHSEYRDRFVGYPRSAPVHGRVLCLAPTRLPSEALDLLAIPRVAATSGLAVRVAGPAPMNLASNFATAAAKDPTNISARLEPLSDGAQVQEIDAAELVLAPQVETLEQEQTVMLALSLNRPVLTPRTEAMTQLALQVGPGWMYQCDGRITAAAIDTTLASLRAGHRPGTQPNFTARGLKSTQRAYAALFQDVSTRRHQAAARRAV